MRNSVVKILKHSVTLKGIPLITFQAEYWRPIHSELMTHRVFSRNAGSSRARPVKAIIDQVRDNPWGPLHWGANQKGMQAEHELVESGIQTAKILWREAANSAADKASEFEKLGVHKQIVNRILEPYTSISVVLTATDFNNWYELRNHKDAQPEIRELAQNMFNLQTNSTPELLLPGDWHLPYIAKEDHAEAYDHIRRNAQYGSDLLPLGMDVSDAVLELLKKMSAARCARVSYKAFDGSNPSIDSDLELYRKLVISRPVHASPTEHQATPDITNPDGTYRNPNRHGNLRGWCQFRKFIPGEFTPG